MATDLSLRAAALVALGGALGCVLRYVAGALLSRPGWPWGTLAVNLAGSFLIALLMFGALSRAGLDLDARLFLVTGVLGGFTTMSAFAYETVALAEGAAYARASLYALVTFAGCLGMAFAGRLAARLLP